MTLETVGELVANLLANYDRNDPVIAIIWSSLDVTQAVEYLDLKCEWQEDDTRAVLENLDKQADNGFTLTMDDVDDQVRDRAIASNYISHYEEQAA